MKTTTVTIFFNVNILVFSQFSRDFSHLTWVPWGVWAQTPGPHIGLYLLVSVTDGRILLLFDNFLKKSQKSSRPNNHPHHLDKEARVWATTTKSSLSSTSSAHHCDQEEGREGMHSLDWICASRCHSHLPHCPKLLHSNRLEFRLRISSLDLDKELANIPVRTYSD